MKTFYLLISLLTFYSCSFNGNKRLSSALSSAHSNRAEIEQVLVHYQNDPLKLQAAHFLIENMIGHAGYDATYLSDLKDLYAKHEAISVKYNWDDKNKDWRKEIDSLWKVDKRNPQYSNRHQRKDIELVKAKWLINEIDRSFTAWQENTFTKHLPFDDFCHYILPYRVINGVCIDNGREDFYNRHQHFFKDTTIPVITLVDSLLDKYADLKHNRFYAASFPIYENKGFEQVKFGLCSSRVWFNYALLSALGMPATIDFVHAWGNRNSAHEWNSLLIDGETHAFEPFWERDRWRYKAIYGNKVTDASFGKFRLPKVFRYTYKHQTKNPFLGKQEVLPLFKHPLIEDVSAVYFETTDVTYSIPKKHLKKNKYTYLCVYNKNKWVPVQCAEIENENAIFKQMGRDILYLPAVHKNGQITPIGSPFILTMEGKMTEVLKTDEFQDIVVRDREALKPQFHTLKASRGIYFSISDSINSNIQLLDRLNETPDWWEGNKINLPTSARGRYIHLTFRTDIVRMNELVVNIREDSKIKQLQNIKVLTPLKATSSLSKTSYLSDGLSSTGFHGTILNKNNEIKFDLGKTYELESIKYFVYSTSIVSENTDYTLEYWDNNRWNQLATKQKKIDDFLVFNQVPKGTIYRLLIPNDTKNRVFTYDNGIVYWY